MTKRENTLSAIRFDRPDYIPMSFHINAACWHHYDQNALQDLMEAHPFLFPDFTRLVADGPSRNPTRPAIFDASWINYIREESALMILFTPRESVER